MNYSNYSSPGLFTDSSFSLVKSPSIQQPASKDPWLTELRQLLDEHITQSNFSNSKIARLMCVSDRHFYRRVQQITGRTPNQFITTFRMQKALALIKTGHYKTAKEIAYAVGYKKDSYFNTLYKKTYGKTPLETLRYLNIR